MDVSCRFLLINQLIEVQQYITPGWHIESARLAVVAK
jgi:hypothetical protein